MERLLAGLTARTALVLFLLFVFIVGCFVAGTGLHDPDTCWLLALGRYMFEHGSLPHTDPFSYTFALPPVKPFVMYQWLSELLFYISYRASGLVGLLVLVALLVAEAFIAVPMEVFHRLNFPRLAAAFLTIMSMVAACFHTLARPEAFSYIMLAFWLRLMWMLRLDQAPEKFNWRIIGAMALVMALWCNMHTGFTAGLSVLAWYVLSANAEWLICARTIAYPHLSAVAALGAALAATLLNPFGIGLWQYIPSLFFSPINKYIDELRPLGLAELKEWTYQPFVILCLVSVILYCLHLKTLKDSGARRWNLVFAPVIIAFCIYEGCTYRRLIPFSALVILTECAGLWRAPALESNEGAQAVPALAEQKFAALLQPSGLRWFSTVGVLATIGVLFIAFRVVAPTLPQASLAFPAPFAAIDYLKQHPPRGRLFNEAQFGDLMIWYMQPVIPVFMDTRFDMYGADLVTDYAKMRNCREGWQDLLTKYQIDTVFLKKDCELARQLARDPAWSAQYKDEQAVILQHR